MSSDIHPIHKAGWIRAYYYVFNNFSREASNLDTYSCIQLAFFRHVIVVGGWNKYIVFHLRDYHLIISEMAICVTSYSIEWRKSISIIMA